MKIPFYKYQGTGNDFVMIDNRNDDFPSSNHKMISTLCDRRFGIGADGVILLQKHEKVDFIMHYFNADGKPGSFCGNGGRCIVAFAKQLGIIDRKTIFAAYDGLHEATIVDNVVSLSMADVNHVSVYPKHVFLDTGSPHHVAFVTNTIKLDVPTQGALIAHNKTYGIEGSNVNFVSVDSEDYITVRTFERGVEDETLSCGTGVIAAVLAAFSTDKIKLNQIQVQTPGGLLRVSFQKQKDSFTDIVLTGPTELVYSGTIYH
mgnify:CR=1 FL=1